MNFDRVLAGGKVVLEDCVEHLDIGIRSGRIAGLLTPGTATGDGDLIDVTGHYVLPGAIDPHTHVEWPIGEDNSQDDFLMATMAAAIHGTTTIIDFVPIARGIAPLDAIEARVSLAEGSSVIDYGFHPILTSGTRQVVSQIGEMIKGGFASFKIYTTYDDLRLDGGEIWTVMQEIAHHGGIAGFHAECHDLIGTLTRACMDEGRVGIEAFPASRPGLAESQAIGMVARYARELDAPIYIFHASGEQAVTAIREQQRLGTRVQAETCTHYLALNDEVFSGPDAWRYVITPPIRDEGSREALWSAVKDRTVCAVASDHCAYGRRHKRPGFDDFTRMPPGAPGIAARVPVTWDEGINRGRLTPVDFSHAISTGAARALGLYPRKGVLRVGSDADIMVVDPAASWTWDHREDSGSDYSLYEQRPGRGAVRMTLAAGKVIARDGRFVGGSRTGAFLARRATDDHRASGV